MAEKTKSGNKKNVQKTNTIYGASLEPQMILQREIDKHKPLHKTVEEYSRKNSQSNTSNTLLENIAEQAMSNDSTKSHGQDLKKHTSMDKESKSGSLPMAPLQDLESKSENIKPSKKNLSKKSVTFSENTTSYKVDYDTNTTEIEIKKLKTSKSFRDLKME